ncbi:THO complex subunit 6 homolog [Anneissia japonica]|uniref:THO complex subunit 6 homolog n=1 Tax=Anneissia japonica TaxID=1529436 RepID=UPI001425BB04|nr:THO complex subunit 6 homolog [Anneissia japonica]
MTTVYQNQILNDRKSQHLTVFSQCFSPCGNYLVIGNNYGTISVFNLMTALSSNANEHHRKPSFSYQACSGPIYSIVSSELFLICAGSGDIKAYKWADILQKVSYYTIQ